MLMGAGGLGSAKGEGLVLGAGAGIGAGGVEDEGAEGAGPIDGVETTGGAVGGPDGPEGAIPIVGLIPP
jgi:hypothetical protein